MTLSSLLTLHGAGAEHDLILVPKHHKSGGAASRSYVLASSSLKKCACVYGCVRAVQSVM